MIATIERATAENTAPKAGTAHERAVRYILAGTRLALGWIFLWAFIDKMFGLGMATESKNAWINGGSPTKGFLTFGVTAVLPPENNPFMDDHLIYAAVLAVLALVNAGDTWGLGRMWARLPIVQRTPWLR